MAELDREPALRVGERYLLIPPLDAKLGGREVMLLDVSAGGARIQHSGAIPAESTMPFEVVLGDGTAIRIDATVAWTQLAIVNVDAESSTWVSGLQIVSPISELAALVMRLLESKHAVPINELRRHDRLILTPPLAVSFDPAGASMLLDLSFGGARIAAPMPPEVRATGLLRFTVPGRSLSVIARATVRWLRLSRGDDMSYGTYECGIVVERSESFRAAFEMLLRDERGSIDVDGIRRRHEIERERAILRAKQAESVSEGITAEPLLLIRQVRAELFRHPDAAEEWFRRARLTMTNPDVAKNVEEEMYGEEALAVWEYLDRSVDLATVCNVFRRDLV